MTCWASRCQATGLDGFLNPARVLQACVLGQVEKELLPVVEQGCELCDQVRADGHTLAHAEEPGKYSVCLCNEGEQRVQLANGQV